VDNPTGSKDPEDEDSSSKGGVGEDVEDAEAKEGEDVLHVVQVGAPLLLLSSSSGCTFMVDPNHQIKRNRPGGFSSLNIFSLMRRYRIRVTD